MRHIDTVDEHQIFEGIPTDFYDPTEGLRASGQTERFAMEPEIGRLMRTFDELDMGVRAQDYREASLPFESIRANVRDALRAIVAHVFEKFDLPTRELLDIGCGPTAEMQKLDKCLETGCG